MEQNKEPRNKPLMYGQLIFHKGGKEIQWRRDRAPAASAVRKGRQPYVNQCQSTLMPQAKITQNGLRHNSIKLLEENIQKA